MRYRFAKSQRNYADYAGGKVFYSLPGHPAFPIRLASEIFQRCLAIRRANGQAMPCVLYDPCCGGAYHLSTLGYLHGQAIAEIIASDVDEDALALARRNLGLLTLAGINRRIAEIHEMLMLYDKTSHAVALASAETLKQQLQQLLETHQLRHRVFQADATDADAIRTGMGTQTVDVVITDVPYGQHSEWHGGEKEGDIGQRPRPTNNLHQMLTALLPALASGAVVAVAADKGQTIAHEAYQRLDKFRVGKRQVALLAAGCTPKA
jgi:hypothetical protein